MGEAAEEDGQGDQISREEQDKIAHLSHVNAGARLERRDYAGEVMHVIPPPYDKPSPRTTSSGKTRRSRRMRRSRRSSIASTGRITAGNSSPLTDGASALW